jgi:hypothetical protein
MLMKPRMIEGKPVNTKQNIDKIPSTNDVTAMPLVLDAPGTLPALDGVAVGAGVAGMAGVDVGVVVAAPNKIANSA